MSRAFVTLSTLAELDLALQVSHTQPILLFKHSVTCGTSAAAHEELLDLLGDDRVTSPFYMVLVPSGRPVSLAIADRFGVRHESPQALVIDRGVAVWNGSHWRVTAAEVRAQLEQATRRRSEVSSPA